MSKLESSNSEVLSSSRLLLTVVKAKGLSPRDKNGLADPYLVVYFKHKQNKKFQTKAIDKTLNPEWNETFAIPLSLEDTILTIQVWDKDLTLDEFMGQAHLDISDASNLDTEITLTLEQKHDQKKEKKGKNTEVTGEVVLRTKLLSVSDNDDIQKDKKILEKVKAKIGDLKRVDEQQVKQLVEDVKNKLPPEIQQKINELIKQLQEYKEALVKLTEEYQKLIIEKAQLLKELADEKTRDIREKINEKVEIVKEKIEDTKALLIEKVEQKVAEKLEKALDKVSEMLKKGLKGYIFEFYNFEDEEMPDTIKRAVDAIVDEIMPDVKQEIIGMVFETIHNKIEKAPPPDEGKPTSECRNPLSVIRSFLLYHLYPYDKSFWSHIKNPYTLILTVISIIPAFGISQVWNIFLFFLIDKHDEFQLCSYILGFKGTQFFSGVISSIVGAILYFACANRDDPTCDTSGPGEQWPIICLFVIQIILIWTSFILLPFSKKKGGRFFKYSKALRDEELHCECGGLKCHKNRGGRLRWLILYDTLAFSIVAVLTLACAFYFRSPEDNDISSIASDWKFKADLYWLRNLYALTAIPFVPFILPGVFIFLTHAKATGYSRYGKTMPKVVYKSKYTREEKKRRKKSKGAEEDVKLQAVTVVDSENKSL